jgi:TonB family protein
MKLFTGFCLVAVLGTGLTLCAQSGSMLTTQVPPPPPGANAQTPSPQSDATGYAQKPARVSGGVMAGLLVKKVQPEYPSDVEAQGAVVLHAIIGADGKVQHLSVISGPESLQALAVSAVQQWEYKPYMLNGQPTPVDTTVVVNFRR